MNKDHDQCNSYKHDIQLRQAYSFRGSVHYRGRKHGSLQADMVLEKELRVLRLDPQAKEVNATVGLA